MLSVYAMLPDAESALDKGMKSHPEKPEPGDVMEAIEDAVADELEITESAHTVSDAMGASRGSDAGSRGFVGGSGPQRHV